MVEALVLDFDGLILDTETSEFETVRDVYASFGFALTVDQWTDRIGTNSRPWLDELDELVGGLPDREEVRERRVIAHHERILTEAILPGVESLLGEATERGLALGVASTSSYDWVGGHLERLGLLHHFSCVACRNEQLRPKPAPDVYLHACAELGVTPAVAVAFEDSAHGVKAASAAGLRVVAVPSHLTRSLDFGDADLVLGSLAEVSLDDLLRKLGANEFS